MHTQAGSRDPGEDLRACQRRAVFISLLLLVTHAAMLARSALCHGPTKLEPAFLVAGLSHWQFGRFEVFRVNPPLVRMVAAVPVLAGEFKFDWSGYNAAPGARSEFSLGAKFLKENGADFPRMLSYARWACIPFSLIGALFCGFWARELWRSDVAGVAAIAIWCSDPNILAHGELITTDCAATSFGLGAGYLFWRWLHRPSWGRAIFAGAVLGLALLSKTSWLLLLALWPVIWVLWAIAQSWRSRLLLKRPESPRVLRSIGMLCGIAAIACYTVNLGYGFDGTGTTLGEYQFFSNKLSGTGDPKVPGNRFRNSIISNVPILLPREFINGVDLQMRDFEDYPQPSYLRGEWKKGGWWYYYIYCTLVKLPHGSQVLLLATLLLLTQSLAAAKRSWLDLVVLALPATALFFMVSAQLEFNHHFRYVLPAFGYFFVLMAGLAGAGRPAFRGLAFICIAVTGASVLRNYPHQLAYFNEFSGGPHRGAEHLLGSNFDWGQDAPLVWAEYRQNQDSRPEQHVVLLTDNLSDISALYPRDAFRLQSATYLGDHDADTLVISQSALECEDSGRRQRNVDYVSAWLARRNGHFTKSYPSPTIVVLRKAAAVLHAP